MKYILLLLYFFGAAAYAQQLPVKGLVAYYPFNGNANDESGNGNNPVFNNASLTSDRDGNARSAYAFNGINQYMQFANSPAFNFRGDFTISCWVKVTGFYQGACHGNRIIMKGDADYQDGNYYLTYDDNYFTRGENCNRSYADEAHQLFYTTGPTVIDQPIYATPDKWTLLTTIRRGAEVRFYVNCTLAAHGRNRDPLVNNYDLFFGRLNDSRFPYWFHGSLDEVRFYDRALSDSELNLLCNKPSDPEISFSVRLQDCTKAQVNITQKRYVAGFEIDYGDGSSSSVIGAAHDYKTPGTYHLRLTATGTNGKKIVLKKTIKILKPSASFEYSFDVGSLNAQFTCGDTGLKEYQWSFGDGTTAAGSHRVTHQYPAPGSYRVSLQVGSRNGCKESSSQDIIIAELPGQLADSNLLTTKAADSLSPVLEERALQVIKEIETRNDSVSVTFYDNAEIDGDSVTIIYNGVQLARHLRLTDQPQSFRLAVDKGRSVNELVMYAENLGSIPPNTALMVIYDGDTRYELSVSSSKTSSGAVRFRFRKKIQE